MHVSLVGSSSRALRVDAEMPQKCFQHGTNVHGSVHHISFCCFAVLPGTFLESMLLNMAVLNWTLPGAMKSTPKVNTRNAVRWVAQDWTPSVKPLDWTPSVKPLDWTPSVKLLTTQNV